MGRLGKAGSSQARTPEADGLPLVDLLTLEDQTDETGRLLLEDSAPAKAVRQAARAGVAMDTVSCPFSDTPSRHGGQMNRPAYEALRADLGEVLDGFAWLAGHYYGSYPYARLTAMGLVDLSKVATSLPLLLFHRADSPVPAHGVLPSFVASIFKASRGVHSAAFDLATDRGPQAKLGGGADVVEFVEAGGYFTRPDTKRVCAAPTRLVQRTLDVILTGEGAHPERSRLGDMASFERLWAFHQLEQTFGRGLSHYRGYVEQVMSAHGNAKPQKLFSARIDARGRQRTFGELTEEFLEFANAVQSDLNGLLGRADDAPAVTFNDVVRAF